MSVYTLLEELINGFYHRVISFHQIKSRNSRLNLSYCYLTYKDDILQAS